MGTSCCAGASSPCQPPACRSQPVCRVQMKSRSSCNQPASGCFSLYQSQPSTNYPLKNQKIFLSWFCGGWLLVKHPKNLTRKTCRGGFHVSAAGLSCSWLLCCSGISNQERIGAFQLTLLHPNSSQLKDRLGTADECAWIPPVQADLQRCCALVGPGELVRWSESPLRRHLSGSQILLGSVFICWNC